MVGDVAVVGATGTLGRAVVRVAREAGHGVREIARSTGVDVLTGAGLAEALEGVDAVIECLKPPTYEADGASAWFTAALRSLGEHSRAAGISRTVAVSIVGIDEMQDYGFYRAQRAHEEAVREHCPGAVVVRATQFHDFVGTKLRRVEDHLEIIDVSSQPVDTRVVSELLLERAVAVAAEPLAQIAGPRPENTLDQARRLLAARGDDTPVRGVPASASMSRGAMLPGSEVPTAGCTYDQWLAQHEAARREELT